MKNQDKPRKTKKQLRKTKKNKEKQKNLEKMFAKIVENNRFSTRVNKAVH